MDESELNRAMDRYACGDAAAFSLLHQGLYRRLLAFLTRIMRMQKSIEMHGLATHDGEPSLRVLAPGELEAMAARSAL